MKSTQTRRAVTLVEVLVALSIIGLLLALASPAIQRARSAAQAIACRSNLRQIGSALTQYQDAFGVFPHHRKGSIVFRPGTGMHAGPFIGPTPSVFLKLTPYLDRAPVHDAFNYDVLSYSYGVGGWLADFAPPFHASNRTVVGTSMAIFLCPSDDSPVGRRTGLNYRVNVGIGIGNSPTIEKPDSGNGPFYFENWTRPSHVLDGYSKTIGVSERVRGSGGPPGALHRDYIETCGPNSLDLTADYLLAWLAVCASPDVRMNYGLGASWAGSGLFYADYQHAQTPNGWIPDGGEITGPDYGVVTARSRHDGGVHSLALDGAVHFVGNNIDRTVWRAWGTRASGDVSSPF